MSDLSGLGYLLICAPIIARDRDREGARSRCGWDAWELISDEDSPLAWLKEGERIVAEVVRLELLLVLLPCAPIEGRVSPRVFMRWEKGILSPRWRRPVDWKNHELATGHFADWSLWTVRAPVSEIPHSLVEERRRMRPKHDVSAEASIGEGEQSELNPSAFLDQADREEAAIATSATTRRRRVESSDKLFRPSDQTLGLFIAFDLLSRDYIAVLIVVKIGERSWIGVDVITDIKTGIDPIGDDLKALDLPALIFETKISDSWVIVISGAVRCG